jgi:hypothetical protein
MVYLLLSLLQLAPLFDNNNDKLYKRGFTSCLLVLVGAPDPNFPEALFMGPIVAMTAEQK